MLEQRGDTDRFEGVHYEYLEGGRNQRWVGEAWCRTTMGNFACGKTLRGN
jgi:hypothetical protein